MMNATTFFFPISEQNDLCAQGPAPKKIRIDPDLLHSVPTPPLTKKPPTPVNIQTGLNETRFFLDNQAPVRIAQAALGTLSPGKFSDDFELLEESDFKRFRNSDYLLELQENRLANTVCSILTDTPVSQVKQDLADLFLPKYFRILLTERIRDLGGCNRINPSTKEILKPFIRFFLKKPDNITPTFILRDVKKWIETQLEASPYREGRKFLLELLDEFEDFFLKAEQRVSSLIQPSLDPDSPDFRTGCNFWVRFLSVRPEIDGIFVHLFKDNPLFLEQVKLEMQALATSGALDKSLSFHLADTFVVRSENEDFLHLVINESFEKIQCFMYEHLSRDPLCAKWFPKAPLTPFQLTSLDAPLPGLMGLFIQKVFSSYNPYIILLKKRILIEFAALKMEPLKPDCTLSEFRSSFEEALNSFAIKKWSFDDQKFRCILDPVELFDAVLIEPSQNTFALSRRFWSILFTLQPECTKYAAVKKLSSQSKFLFQDPT
ncbi:MAG: hypothetical protein FJZ61_05565 [Chlamydiae bacterium]|nr:hypothetical protein [Chlamydiota bacterium]